MKLRHKLMLLTLIAMLAMPMFIVGPGGKPIMSANEWLPGNLTFGKIKRKAIAAWNAAGGVIEAETGVDATIQTPKMYKWKDYNGNWQFASEPPPENTANEVYVKEMPKLGNVMEPVKVQARDNGSDSAGAGFKLAFPSTIPVQDIPKLVNDAKKLQHAANQRKQSLESY
ncbi:MAG: hypothetical protein ACR2PS_09790 [Pseudomonadales bacterium]